MQSDPNITGFLIFDYKVNDEEMLEPFVYYSYYTIEQPPNFILNQAGLFITFVSFCKMFNKSQLCDYVRTQQQETALYELDSNVWMSITRELDNPIKIPLLAILKEYKNIFNLFFPPLKREETTKLLDSSSKESIKRGFDLIIQSDFDSHFLDILLYNSYYWLELAKEMVAFEFEKTINLILTVPRSPIQYLAIEYIEKLLYNNFPNDVINTLLICLKCKLKNLLFVSQPHGIDAIYYEIGMNIKANEMVINSPKLYINNHIYHLVIIRIQSFRLIVTLKEEIGPTEGFLNSLPRLLIPIYQFLASMKMKDPIPSKIKSSFFQIKASSNSNHLSSYHYKLPITQFPPVQSLLMSCYRFVNDSFLSYKCIGLSTPNKYFIWYQKDRIAETAVILKTDSKKVSELIDESKCYNDPSYGNQIEFSTRNGPIPFPIFPI